MHIYLWYIGSSVLSDYWRSGGRAIFLSRFCELETHHLSPPCTHTSTPPPAHGRPRACVLAGDTES